MKLKSISLVIFSLLLSNQLFAQYIGPGSVSTYKSIKDVISNPVEDAHVVLEGYLTKQLNAEKYLFSDGISEIRVEIDRDKFPMTTINEKTKIKITGEVEKEFLQSPEIDVDFVEIIR